MPGAWTAPCADRRASLETARTDASNRQTEAASSTKSFSRNCPIGAEIAGKPPAAGSATPGVLTKNDKVMRSACQVALARTAQAGWPTGMTRIPYRGFRFPKPIIQHAVWLYARFTLSLRDVEDLSAERGITVSYETNRVWVARFGPLIARRLRRQRGRPSDTWHLDEMFVRIRGRQMYLWRAVDAEGEILEVLVQSRRNKRAALRLMRNLLKKQGMAPGTLVTDRLGAYPAAVRELGLSSAHVRGKRKNNRAESSHVPIRRRERKMQGFRSAGSAQRFLAFHAAVADTFATCRHLVSAKTHRLLRNQAFVAWRQAAILTA
jgi:transposase-like protein